MPRVSGAVKLQFIGEGRPYESRAVDAKRVELAESRMEVRTSVRSKELR